MEKTVRRFAVDRREGDFWVLVPDGEGDDLLLPVKSYPHLSENDVADVSFDGGISLTLLPEEKEKRLSDMDRRLAALFARGKNPGERK